MKKNIKLLILLLILSVPSIVFSAGYYDEKTIEKIMNCRYENTSQGFENLFSDVDDHWVRFYYGEALIAEKKYDEALNVYKKIANYASDKKLKYQANQYVYNIIQLKDDMQLAKKSDTGSYYNDIGRVAKWEDYKNIKIYIENEPNLDYLYEQAFDIWNRAIPYFGFVYVNDKNEADIRCSFVQEFFDQKVGVTKYPKGMKIVDGEMYLQAPVLIEVSKSSIDRRQVTEEEILSTIIHEVGHALGILGHSKNRNDIMFFDTTTYQGTSLSQRDINTIDEIYQ